ncbi:hypothetical protein HQ576_00350 [bacterium]|nr:hypothetical protein [bacterium]
MTQQEFLQEIVGRLQQHGLPYMVTGSLASGAYGEPRNTYDTDIVVDASWPALAEFVRAFDEADFYVSQDAARDAWRHRRMFNIIHFRSGNRLDVICRKDSEYARVAFERRRPEAVIGTEAVLCSPEDIILAKLDWGRKGESDRQYRDALGVAKARRNELDVPYMTKWAAELRIEKLLARLLRDAEIPPK